MRWFLLKSSRREFPTMPYALDVLSYFPLINFPDTDIYISQRKRKIIESYHALITFWYVFSEATYPPSRPIRSLHYIVTCTRIRPTCPQYLTNIFIADTEDRPSNPDGLQAFLASGNDPAGTIPRRLSWCSLWQPRDNGLFRLRIRHRE